MAELALVRVDSRLIHGQVIAGWYKHTSASKIIIIDDKLKTDKFMAQIFKMAAPPGAGFEILTAEEAAERWKKDQLGAGRLIVLFSSVASAWSAYEQGFTYPKLQIGGIGSAPGKIKVHGPISMDESEAKLLNKLEEQGCTVVFRVIPEYTEDKWAAICAKYFPNI